jgi:hypothetical protein
MKIKLTILVLVFGMISGLTLGQQSKEPYFSQKVVTPDKTSLNFNLFVFHYKYRWVESKTEGKYSAVSLVVQNNKNAKLLNWKDNKIYFLLKDGSLFHNYTTTAKSGNYNCRYSVEPGAQHVQLICFGKKFDPEQVDRAWIKMTHANFIPLLYKSKSITSGGSGNPGTASRRPLSGVGSKADAKALLMKFLRPGADHFTMTQKLRPTQADYKAYFIPDSWQKAKAAYNPAWDQNQMSVKPKPGQTELLLWQASVLELEEGAGNAGKFPGGYRKIMQHIRPGHTIYRFKFVQPGRTLGMAFDGLVFVNGHWVIFPKPWRVFQ